MVCAAEDIGRHNAVDKVIGHAILPLNRHILVVSSRAGTDCSKKLMAGIKRSFRLGHRAAWRMS